MNFPQKHTYLLPIIAILVLVTPGVVFAATWFQDTLWTVVVNFFGMFMGFGGLLLNVGVNEFVIGFGHNFNSQGVGLAVNTLWVAVRDIFNLTFIFGLVYIGFKMILNSDDSNTRKWLVSLIMAALLVNFSLYITKFVVDFSNTLAYQIVSNGFILDSQGNAAISDTFMNNLGISGLFGIQELPPEAVDNGAYGYIFGTMILFIVMAFVFAAGGFLLLIRYAALSLYMILSPLMFIGWVFPGLQSYTSKYWKGFLSRAFFAPIYLLLLYFSAYVITALYKGLQATSGKTPEFAKAFAGGGDAMMSGFTSTLIPFVLSCIFLIASIVVGQKMGADGASAALKVGNNVRGRMQRGAGRFAGGVTVGMAARGMRNTVGKEADKLTRSQSFRNFAAGSWVGKQAFKAAQKGATSSYDVRQVAGLGKATGLGSGVTGGYVKSVKDKKKADDAFLDAIKTEVDVNDPATKAKIDQKAEEMVEKAKAEKPDLDKKSADNKTAHDKTKTEHEAIVADLENNIEVLEAELAENERRGGTTFTQQELSVRQQEIAKDKAELAKQKDEYKKKDLEFKATQYEIENRLKELPTDINVARQYAEAEVQYANELAYIAKMEKDVAFWNKAGSILTGGLIGNQAGVGTTTAVGLGGTATAVGLGGVGLVMGASTVSAFADRTNESIKKLKYEYGPGGIKKAKKKKEVDKYKDFAKAQEELMGDIETKNEEPKEPEETS